MSTNLAGDLNLPSAECQQAPTPAMFRDLCDVDSGAFDSAIDLDSLDFVAASSSDHHRLLDCSLLTGPEGGSCQPCRQNSTTGPWPLLSPLSLANENNTASSTDPNKPRDVSAGGKAKPQSSPCEPRQSGSGPNKLQPGGTGQGRKKKTTKAGQRPHYAVERRYRSTLNERYAALTRTLRSDTLQRICKTEAVDWNIHLEGLKERDTDEQAAGAARQGKTATLSATIEAIGILTKCCQREADELERLRVGVRETREHVRQMVEQSHN